MYYIGNPDEVKNLGKIKVINTCWALVVHTYNPSYLGG
jgi:hypothetical protein